MFIMCVFYFHNFFYNNLTDLSNNMFPLVTPFINQPIHSLQIYKQEQAAYFPSTYND